MMLRRLPDDDILIELVGNDVLCVGAHEVNGCRFFTRVEPGDLPEHLDCLEAVTGLEGDGLTWIDDLARRQYEATGDTGRDSED